MKKLALVTGASGFVGGACINWLKSKGWKVNGIGRRSLDIENYFSHDLANPLPGSYIGNYQTVVHAAAHSSPWGDWSEYAACNIDSTRHIIDFCKRNGLPRLIFISSSSVYYEPKDQKRIVESDPVAKKPVNHYAKSKQIAEGLIQDYPGEWIILRPRAVFGPGDTVLLPRILKAASKGRLPLLMKKNHIVEGDLIYIDNLSNYIERAIETPHTREIYNLTNGNPIPIVEFLLSIFESLDIKEPKIRISPSKAWNTALALEMFYKTFCPHKEPPITRFGVHVFRYSKTFDTTKTLKLLGNPPISMDQARSETVAWFKQHQEGWQ